MDASIQRLLDMFIDGAGGDEKKIREFKNALISALMYLGSHDPSETDPDGSLLAQVFEYQKTSAPGNYWTPKKVTQ